MFRRLWLLLAFLSVLFLVQLGKAQDVKRRVTIEEYTTPAPRLAVPAPVATEERVYFVPATRVRAYVVESENVPATVEFVRGPLGIRSAVRYSNGAEVRYGLFGRVRSVTVR